MNETTRGINNPSALSLLYCPLVRQQVEYASPVWSPYTDDAKKRLEAVQRRFVRLVGVRNGYDYVNCPVETLSSEFNLLPLALRRDVADIIFLVKIFRGLIDSPKLLAEINLRVPSNNRSQELLSRGYHRTNFDFNSPLARFVRLVNRVALNCDIFCDSLPAIRKCAIAKLLFSLLYSYTINVL